MNYKKGDTVSVTMRSTTIPRNNRNGFVFSVESHIDYCYIATKGGIIDVFYTSLKPTKMLLTESKRIFL